MDLDIGAMATTRGALLSAEWFASLVMFSTVSRLGPPLFRSLVSPFARLTDRLTPRAPLPSLAPVALSSDGEREQAQRLGAAVRGGDRRHHVAHHQRARRVLPDGVQLPAAHDPPRPPGSGVAGR